MQNEELQYLDDGTFGMVDFGDDTLKAARNFHGGFVALNFTDSVEALHFVTLLREPDSEGLRHTLEQHLRESTLMNHFISSTSAIPSPISASLKGTTAMVRLHSLKMSLG